jgi:hypothetical protein
MSLREKRYAVEKGDYGFQNPLRHPHEIALEREETRRMHQFLSSQDEDRGYLTSLGLAAVSPQEREAYRAALAPESKGGGLRYTDVVEAHREAYGDFAVMPNSPEAIARGDAKEILNADYIEIVQNMRRSSRAPGRVYNVDEVHKGILSREDRAEPVVERMLRRQRRVAAREQGFWEDVQTNVAAMKAWAEAVQDEAAIREYEESPSQNIRSSMRIKKITQVELALMFFFLTYWSR